MSEMILPGVYIEVRAEGLISAGQVSVGNIGMVGTASRGPVDEVKLISSPSQAREIFGAADDFTSPVGAKPLTLVRALQLAYDNGASAVYAVRVAGANAEKASFALQTVTGATTTTAVTLEATSAGSWGNDIQVNVAKVPDNTDVVVKDEVHVVESDGNTPAGPAAVTLRRKPHAVTRVRVYYATAGQVTKVLTVATGPFTATDKNKVAIDNTGTLSFSADAQPAIGDKVMVTYQVPDANGRLVTLRWGPVTESYLVADGAHLEAQLAAGSALATGDLAGADGTKAPDMFSSNTEFLAFGQGTNNQPGSDGAGAGAVDYQTGLEKLLNEDVHIVVAAGMSAADIADKLLSHVQNASTDKMRRDRIAVVGSDEADDTAAKIAGHDVASDRIVFVGPGVRVTDAASGKKVTLPGAYAAAGVAGMLSARSPHVSLTNKVFAGVETVVPRFSPPELEQLVQARVLALESRNGIRVVKGITTDDGAFKQITTRRIVDYAKAGVRSASQPFIGLLNNDRVRKSLKGSINGFLAGMVDDEMLVAYELDVTATRDEEIRGIARVTMSVQPTFSIDFIKVTMFLG